MLSMVSSSATELASDSLTTTAASGIARAANASAAVNA
jgi:hypothetical protein